MQDHTRLENGKSFWREKLTTCVGCQRAVNSYNINQVFFISCGRMNTCHQTSTSTSSDACFTPTEDSNALARKMGWSSSTVDVDRSSKRLSSVENSGPYFKRRKTPSSCPTTNNEHVITRGKRSLATESERDETEGMNANDVVNQSGNVADIRDDSPSALEIKRVLSVVWSKGNLGSSYYDTETSQLYLQMDVVETNDFQFLKRVKEQVQAKVIITSATQDERLLKILNGQEGENNDEQICETKEVEILPSIDFSYEVCKRRITALNACLPGIPQHFTENERDIHMSSLVPFDNVSMVRSAGALIKYIDKKRIGVEMEDPEVRVPILGLKVFSLSDLLIVDNNTYSALQIFQKESHPSVYKMGAGNSGAKEGLSLFGITNRTKSAIGSHMLRNAELVASLQDCLKHIKNVSGILSRMTTAQASVGDWQALYKTAYNATYIADLCRRIPVDIAIAKKIATSFTDELLQIGSLMSKIIDFDESTEQNRFVVKPGVDPALDEKKRTYNGLPDFMTTVAREELNKLSSSITECNVIYLPQLGYLLAIPRSPELKEESDFGIDGLEFVFLSNNRLHYKSARTRELDNLLGDTQCEITDHETAIMHRLQTVILEHTKVLMDVMECCAELDCLISLAVCARENNYVCPKLTMDSVLNIEQGRHPLQELCVNLFVPNDTVFEKDKGRMKVLTGPNASGKSVYLKQVGLIVFLTHIGSFVPAESATVGITDRIFTRIHTRETVSVGLSTFMIDLNQVATAVNAATDNSLVIVDEFGKGTATIDGLSLLTATLRHWLRQGSSCPKLLVSTHFHSLVKQKLLPQTPLVTYQTMQVMEEDEDIAFLYHLIDGYAESSLACHIASLAGLPHELLKRAQQVTQLTRCNKPILKKDTADDEEQRKRHKAIVTKFLALNLDNEDPQTFLSDLLENFDDR
ncbi:mutS protein homolog 5-like isoform X2 [Stylophora pistillata]|uniref:mutS protein homolog 5-like isoform X2 n=1 Tax=Stylophora pistillata TaxID=50429 RepID=UPI000C0495BE|nr:mutS protein homolog 5-like isoform X2 [Stylophora pistillata]